MSEKECLACKKVFLRNRSYTKKRWEEAKYCSHKCFGSVNGRTRRGMDETKHPKWKGDKVGYAGIHDWMTKHFGQPAECEVCGLEDSTRKYHWANLTNYLRDRKDWKRMCVSCHRKYDYSRQNQKLETA